ncbi:MAG TPA: GNAT family N-acetyltransferase [Actinocatenispora sp.]
MHLEIITPANVAAACALRVAPEQERFVAPVADSLAEAYAHGDVAWPRLIVDGERVVGFLMLGIDPDNASTVHRFGIWRLAIAAGEQGKGYGRYAVEAATAEARARGVDTITVLWERGEGGPEPFYRKLGFVPTGEELAGEVVAALRL